MDPSETDENELYPEETVLDEVDAVLELFAIGAKRRREELRRWLVRIVEEDEDSPALAAKAKSLYRALKHMNQVRLIDLACGYWPAGPLVCGALLNEVLGDREKINLLFEHAGDDILRWFRRVPLDTLMSAEERRALGALPSTVEAWHETIEPTGRVTLGPYWTLPALRGTARGAAGGEPQTPRVVKAQVPRSSVLVYYTGGDVPALIVDFRRVASVEVVRGPAR